MSARIPVHLAPPTEEERNIATLAQLLGLIGYLAGAGQIVCPLIMWFVKRDDSPYVAFHALQTALFHLLVTVLAVVIVIGGFVLLPVVGVGLLVWAIGLPVLLIGALVLNVLGVIAAHKGEWSRYPLVGGWVLPTAPAPNPNGAMT